MKVGDVVIPRNGYLRSGCRAYTHAICASVDPFILISDSGDMRWSATVEIDNFMALCQAGEKIKSIVANRLSRDDGQGTI